MYTTIAAPYNNATKSRSTLRPFSAPVDITFRKEKRKTLYPHTAAVHCFLFFLQSNE